jgi:hypothetical protein
MCNTAGAIDHEEMFEALTEAGANVTMEQVV